VRTRVYFHENKLLSVEKPHTVQHFVNTKMTKPIKYKLTCGALRMHGSEVDVFSAVWIYDG